MKYAQFSTLSKSPMHNFAPVPPPTLHLLLSFTFLTHIRAHQASHLSEFLGSGSDQVLYIARSTKNNLNHLPHRSPLPVVSTTPSDRDGESSAIKCNANLSVRLGSSACRSQYSRTYHTHHAPNTRTPRYSLVVQHPRLRTHHRRHWPSHLQSGA